MCDMGEKMIDWTPWTDKNNFIKPRKDWDSSGNGTLYSTVAYIFDEFFNGRMFCFFKPGVLMRTPDNAFGQESHDDYLAFAVAAILNSAHPSAQEVFEYGFKHFFIMRNEEGSGFKAHLWRFPHVWWLMFVAGWPNLKWIVHLPLFIVQLLQKPPVNDSSGTQLQWLFMIAYLKLYGENNTFRKWKEKTDMVAVFKDYYDPEHPFQELIKEWK